MILLVMVALAAAYQVFAMAACARRRSGKWPVASGQFATSILKPVRGLDPGFREAIASHVALDGEFEVLCGVADLNDPAVAVLREFPAVRVIECPTQTPNGKVGVLSDLARHARYPVVVVNDSDIRVEPDYLRRVTAPLTDPEVGVVTCLYRPVGDSFAARFEGLGVSTDFAPSVLVARFCGMEDFTGGATLAFRRADLERIGGFEVLGEYLADDYQLGRRIRGLGLKCVLSDVIVETHMGGGWRDVWQHQVRWARTIRVSNFWGYLGLSVTFATVWAAVAVAAGEWRLAIALLAARMPMATVAGWFVLRSRDVLRLWALIPLRDLFGAAVWLAGLFGNTVVWRGLRLALRADGRILVQKESRLL